MQIPRDVLRKLTEPVAWTPDALVEVGIPAEIVNKMIAHGKRAVPERCRTVVGQKRKLTEPTTLYIWGPDIPFLLGLGAK